MLELSLDPPNGGLVIGISHEGGSAATIRALEASAAAGARTAATEAADRASKSQSRVEKVYRQSMSALVAVDDLREVAAKRELYRRLARTSDDLREVAERVWYSVLKES